jgi:hypothetical protein
VAPGINILTGDAFGGSQLFNQGGHSLRIPAVDSIYTILINFYGWYLNSGFSAMLNRAHFYTSAWLVV